MRSFKALAIIALFGVSVSAKQHVGVRRMDVEARHRDIALEKKAPRPDILSIVDPGNNNNNNTGNGDSNTTTATQPTATQPTTSAGGGGGGGFGGPPTEITTTSSPVQNAQTTSTTQPVVVQQQTTTTTTTPATTSATSSSPVVAGATTISRSVADTYQGTTLYANAGTLSNYLASQSATATDATTTSSGSSGGSFLQNKSAVAATFTILGIVAAAALVFVGFWFYKKNNRGKLGDEDMWDEASMKEFSGPPPTSAIAAPSAAMVTDGYGSGLARKKTVLPSQSVGANPLNRSRSNVTPPGRGEVMPDEEPDEMLALPPVTNYDRPRDSAYDIVPAAPPAAAAAYASQGGGYGQAYGYGNAYASSSGAGMAAGAGSSGLHPPRKGDHTSFGSGLGNDPFAGSGFTDATRESSFGPGQAGRGAGYNMASTSHDGHVGAGNQWPQGYNPYQGYSQGSQSPYGGGGGYGYAQ